jgi:hypothetical protein
LIRVIEAINDHELTPHEIIYALGLLSGDDQDRNQSRLEYAVERLQDAIDLARQYRESA